MIRFADLSLILLCGMTVAAHAAESPTVLALGDSITAGGGSSFVCYRQVLVPELKKRGTSVRFIGPNEDAASRHAGYGGRSTADLRSMAKSVYQQYPADLVLLHSGHNSFAKNEPVPGIIRDTETMIKDMHSINPRVTVLLAQVIPSGKLPKYSYIPALNKELASLSERLTQQGYRVVLVNQADGFDWNTDTVADRVHPNQSGARKMADKWLAALLPIIEAGGRR